jgi:hypothetical protein
MGDSDNRIPKGQCPERRGDLACTQPHPHPMHSHDFWPMSEEEKLMVGWHVDTPEVE